MFPIDGRFRIVSILCLALFLAVAMGTSARAQEEVRRLSYRAGEDVRIEVLRAPGFDDVAIVLSCVAVGRTPPARTPLIYGATAPAAVTNPLYEPRCRYPSNRDRTRTFWGFRTLSARDTGTWELSCTFRSAWIAPHEVDVLEDVDRGCGRPDRRVLPSTFGTSIDYLPLRLFVEVTNAPPTLRLTHSGTGEVLPLQFRHDGVLTLRADARDPDTGRTPDVEWTIYRPDGVITRSTGLSLNLPFAGEADFGDWVVDARAIDAAHEYVEEPFEFAVVNREPRPVISGLARVALGDPLVLEVSPDEDGGDYAAVNWEGVSPSGAVIRPVPDPANPRRIELRTDGFETGIWTFRVSVTDNETPPLSGGAPAYEVEVYNEPPVITVTPPDPIIAAGSAGPAMRVSATDPDGGPVTLRAEVFQSPDLSLIAPGTVIARGTDTMDVTLPTAPTDAGTWVIRIVAEDDEPPPAREQATEDVTYVVDALPEANISAPLQLNQIEPLVLDGSASFDPDSLCDLGPECRHSTADGSPVTGITPGITRYRWDLVSATPDDPDITVDLGPLSELYGLPYSAALAELPGLSLPGGHFLFRLIVTDAEGNDASIDHAVQIIAPNSDPVALLSPPQRVLLSPLGGVTTPAIVSGRASFDPDNVLTGALPGISRYDWADLGGAGACISPPVGGSSDTWPLITGGVVPGICQGVYLIGLTVTDDDAPDARMASAVTTLSVGTCDTLVCIDLPTTEIPSRVAFAEDTDILILYHVDPIAARSPLGLHTRLNIYHDSDPLRPVFTSQVSNRVTGTLSPLLVFHWDGYWGPLRPRAGRYDVEITLMQPNLFGPPVPIASVRESGAILIEVADLTITSAPHIVPREVLDTREGTFDLSYEIDGALTPDRVVMTIRDDGGDVVGRVEATGRAGTLSWDGRPPRSRVTVPAGMYEATVEGFLGTRNLTGAVRHEFALVDVHVSQTTPGRDLAIMVNRDDDNLNGVRDFDEVGDFPGDDEVMGLSLRLDPPLDGTFILSSSEPRWTNFYAEAAKNGTAFRGVEARVEHSAEAAAAIWVETGSPGQSEMHLDLAFETFDGRTATLGRQDLNLVQLFARHGSEDGVVDYLDIGRLNQRNQYGAATSDPATNLPLINTGEFHDFIGLDPQRTELYLIDTGVFDGAPGRPIPALDLTVETRLADGTQDDDPTAVFLDQVIAGDGELLGVDHLLMPPDLPRNPDDDFEAHDGRTGPVADDAPGDRTHRADVDGSVRITYRRSTGEVWAFNRPVCQRQPEQRRHVYIRLNVLRDTATGRPYLPATYGTDAARYAADLIAGANSAWAPYCIKFFWFEPPRLVDAPFDPALPTSAGDILADGNLDPADRQILIDAFAPGLRPDVFDFFTVPDDPGALGRTFGPQSGRAALGLNSFATIAVDHEGIMTAAHELGHLLTNGDHDVPGPTYILYPIHTRFPDGSPTPWIYNPDDDRMHVNRRIADHVIDWARTDRSEAHATPGDITSAPPPPHIPGNYALFLPGVRP